MRHRWAALAAFALSLSGVGIARAAPIVLDHITWLETPNWAETKEAFAGAGAADRVTMVCRLNDTGTLRACSPERSGASSAAVRAAEALIPHFRADVNSLAVESLAPLRVRIAFRAPDAAGPGTIDKPAWTQALPVGLKQKVFPAKAADAGVASGRAVLECVANGSGAMTDCQVKSEEPPNMDFGPAAVRVAGAMVMSAWTDDGLPAEGSHVTFAIRLNKAG